MRWDGLFADLEAQSEALADAERAAEIDERTRLETGRLNLVDRLRAAAGLVIRLRLAGGLMIAGGLRRAGPEWLLVDEAAGREAIVAVSAVLSVSGLDRHTAPGGSIVESRLGLRHALRGVSRDRSGLRLHLTDASVVDGTIDRVGADFVELAVHAAGEARRRSEVRELLAIPIGAIAAVRRDS